ncbi:MAG: methyltransferase domain-containing protein [Pseudonocardiaceae bacterium]
MSVDTASRAERAGELRNSLVDKIIVDHAAKGLAMRADVERAMRKVPRDLFTPDVPLEEAYEDTAVITIRRGAEAISSVSAPYLIAEMLGQAADALGCLEGHHALEIGSGGYNASLLRELVGPSGSVTTVDIDPEVTDRAVACLAAAGYHDVTVVCADAEHPIAPTRRYDLIIVTAGAWDIPPAWREQLTDGGVLVVPLRMFGITKSWALRHRGGRLVSASHRQCGFVSMQGDGAHEVRYVDIAAKAVMDLFNPDHRFGFQHIGNRIAQDEPGFLVGAAGVALALANYGDLLARDVPTRWDALLLLS